MQKVLVHVAMVLLGVTLTVGFYEGRRLVKNTARALTAASTLSTTGGRQQAREARSGGEDDEDAEEVDVDAADPVNRKPRIDPDQVGAARLRARPSLAVEPGALTEPPDPMHRGKRGGRGGRRGNKAERLTRLDPTRVDERLEAIEEHPPVAPVEGEGQALPEDTAAP